MDNIIEENPCQQPSPQTVGSEFVRQYYTLLNKAPNYMHRFYNNYSSYTHGDSQVIVGKRDINIRIQELGFKDCKAYITQVKSQASPGDGVVVQVRGVMSNNGQPMRRFLQTVVLVEQSRKKYYVHNDIFSYLDIVGIDVSQEQDYKEEPHVKLEMLDQAVQVACNRVSFWQDLAMEEEPVEYPGGQMVDEVVACNIESLSQNLAIEEEQEQNEEPEILMLDQAVQVAGYLVSLKHNLDKLDVEPSVMMLNQAVQVARNLVSLNQDLSIEEEQEKNEEHVEMPEIQMLDQAVQVACNMVSFRQDLAIEDEQDQNKKQVEEPRVQMIDQAVQVPCNIPPTDHDLGRKDIEDQVEKPDIQKLDKAVQVARGMVSKYTQQEQVDPGTTSNAASQTVKVSLETEVNLPPPQTIPRRVTPRRKSPAVQQLPSGTPGGLEESPQLTEQQRQEQPPHSVTQKEEKESTITFQKMKTMQEQQLNNKPNSTTASSGAEPDKVLPRKQLLFSESIGSQTGADQTNTNGNKRYGKSSIRLEIEISIYLVDEP